MHMKKKNNLKRKIKKISILVLGKTFLFTFILIFNCSFEPKDLVFKNVKLIPELLDDKDNTFHMPSEYGEEKTEKIFDQPVLPSVEGEQVADRLIDIKGILHDTVLTTGDDLKKMIPNKDSIDYMFNLSNLGINLDTGNSGTSDIKVEFLEKEAKKVKIPIINDLEPMPLMPEKIPLPPGLNKKAKGLEINNPIEDIQINGIDDVLPQNPGAGLTESDYDFDPYIHFFDDFLDPDSVLDTPILGVVP